VLELTSYLFNEWALGQFISSGKEMRLKGLAEKVQNPSSVFFTVDGIKNVDNVDYMTVWDLVTADGFNLWYYNKIYVDGDTSFQRSTKGIFNQFDQTRHNGSMALAKMDGSADTMTLTVENLKKVFITDRGISGRDPMLPESMPK
jgi:hypothetical protein